MVFLSWMSDCREGLWSPYLGCQIARRGLWSPYLGCQTAGKGLWSPYILDVRLQGGGSVPPLHLLLYMTLYVQVLVRLYKDIDLQTQRTKTNKTASKHTYTMIEYKTTQCISLYVQRFYQIFSLYVQRLDQKIPLYVYIFFFLTIWIDSNRYMYIDWIRNVPTCYVSRLNQIVLLQYCLYYQTLTVISLYAQI